MRHVLTEGISVGFLTSPVILALIIVKKYGLVEFVYFLDFCMTRYSISISQIQCDLRSFIIPWVYPTNSE